MSVETAGLAITVVALAVSLSKSSIQILGDLSRAMKKDSYSDEFDDLHAICKIRCAIITALGEHLREVQNELKPGQPDRKAYGNLPEEELQRLKVAMEDGLKSLRNVGDRLNKLTKKYPQQSGSSGRPGHPAPAPATGQLRKHRTWFQDFVIKSSWAWRGDKTLKCLVQRLENISDPLMNLLFLLSISPERLQLSLIRTSQTQLLEQMVTKKDIVNALREVKHSEIRKMLEWMQSRQLTSNHLVGINDRDVDAHSEDIQRRTPAVVTIRDRYGEIDYTRQGFVEWRTYDEQGQRDATFVGAQVGLLCNALASTKKPSSARIPTCFTFYRDFTKRRYGMVFYVDGYHHQRLKAKIAMPAPPITLRYLLGKDQAIPYTKSDRLKLADMLANALYTVHSVDVVHKEVHSLNVLFFEETGSTEAGSPSSPTSTQCDIKRPFLGGFMYARDVHSVSEHVQRGDSYELMSLPVVYTDKRLTMGALSAETVYHPSYDLLGLGLTLLEIGLWKPLSDYWTEWRCTTNREFHQGNKANIDGLVEGLNKRMGRQYYDMVRWCLDNAERGEWAKGERMEKFNRKMVELEQLISPTELLSAEEVQEAIA